MHGGSSFAEENSLMGLWLLGEGKRGGWREREVR